MSQITLAIVTGAGLGIFGLSGCSSQPSSASFVDAQAVLPQGAAEKNRYVRRYMLTTVMIGEDTSYFTTQTDFAFDVPRQVWVGVYSLEGQPDERSRSGLRVVSRPEDMPVSFHGGCTIVNLVADAATGETLASWCNIDDRPGPDGAPRRSFEFRRVPAVSR